MNFVILQVSSYENYLLVQFQKLLLILRNVYLAETIGFLSLFTMETRFNYCDMLKFRGLLLFKKEFSILFTSAENLMGTLKYREKLQQMLPAQQ